MTICGKLYESILYDNVCRQYLAGQLITGFSQVDSYGGQHGGIIASDRGSAHIQVPKIAHIGGIGIGVATGAHHPERVAPIGIAFRELGGILREFSLICTVSLETSLCNRQ